MIADRPLRNPAQRLGFDFTEIDPRETSRAWTRFLSSRNAPSIPLTGVRSVIYQSWLRSNTTGVKPEQFAAPSLDRSTKLSKSTYDQAELRRATRASLTQIGALLSGAEAMLILTDRNGVILDTVGDNSTLNKATKINLSVGGVWSEDASGTNGIGTALWTEQPVYVHGEEHFCEGMKAWSCAAAPIRDPIDHSVIGVINLSGLTTIFQKHNAAFAATAARDIEVALEQEQSLLNIRLMEAIIGKYPDHALGAGDGLAIVDRFGRLIFNRNCGPTVGRSGKELGLGARFLEIPDGISEENILASLPAGHGCRDIRMIDIDGVVKGAALVFQASHPTRARTIPPSFPAMPCVVIGNTDLKIVGKSDAILEALDIANRIATADAPTLIEGQTGVGKQLFARLIHSRIDPENLRPFATINCGAVTEEGFRDALLRQNPTTDRNGGKLFPGFLCLDEIGEMPGDIQPTLLRLLEEQMIRLSGPGQPDPAPRVISVTNRNLLDEVEAGRFRRDLFYRLSSIILRVPALKDRGEDILLIAEYYNRKISQETGLDLLIIGSDIQSALMAHSWPGNVRELRNAIASLHYLAKSRRVAITDLPRTLTVPHAPLAPDRTVPPEKRLAGSQSLKQAEVLLIENSLLQCQGNVSKAASNLGISRPTMYRKMHFHGITVAEAKHKRA